MGRITVRVVPKAGRPGVEHGAEGVVVRVRSAPEDRRATAEAARLLATALGVPPTSVVLRRGARSRVKEFTVDGVSDQDLLNRIQPL